MTVRVLVLTGFGINCDYETAFAFSRAGAKAERVHLNDLINNPSFLTDYHVFSIPGGFSFGDDIASGKILANRLRYRLGDHLMNFVNKGKLIIGICNGFQVLVKMGLLPLLDGHMRQDTTLVWNDSGRFEDRWVRVKVNSDSPCVWLRGIEFMDLPVRHGEGKFLTRDDNVLHELQRRGMVALRYVRKDGSPARGNYPENPNGSVDDIAGICDPSGRIFGLMPHPEGHMLRTQHPTWTRVGLHNPDEEGIGLQVFRNAVNYCARTFE